MPPGYSQRQRVGVEPSPSRPLTPAQQFSLMHEQEAWADTIAGNPTDTDLKVCAMTMNAR